MPFNVGQAVGYFDLDTTKFTKGLKSAWKELEVFEKKSATTTQKVNAVGKMLNGVGSTLTKNVTLPIAAAATASVKASVDFESAFAGIRKTVDATESQFAKLKEGILDMSRVMPQSASELAAIGEVAGQLGIQTENILEFTKTMAMLGDTTNLSSEEAASSLARLANITGMSQDEFDRLGSSIVQLGNNFATTEAEITSMALNLAAAGNQVGLSQSEITGFAAALSSVGIQAELGGTALSKVMVQMQLAVETGGKSLTNFATVANMSVDEFSKLFREDAAKAIQTFIAGLDDTERLGNSAIKVLNDMGIKEVRLRDTLLRAASASDMFNSAIEMSNKAWEENVALTSEAEKRYETTESQLKILRNNIVELGIRIGDKLLPALNKLVDNLQGVAKWFADLDDGVVEFLVNFAMIVATVGPVVAIIGKLITTVVKVTTAIKGCTVAMTALKAITTALTGPIGLVVAAVGLLTTAIVLNINKTKIMSEEYRELDKEIKANKKSYEEKNEEINKDTDAMMSNALRAKELYKEMVSLSEQELDTATKVSILTSMQKELKELVPDLVVEIDKETGALRTNQRTVDGLIQSYIDLAIVKRFEDKYTNETKRFLDATEARKEAMENVTRVEKEMKENQDWFDSLNFAGQTFGREGYLAKNSDLKKELSDFQKILNEQDKIIEESKTNMQSFEKEKEEFTKSVYESLGLQEKLNNEVINSDNKVVETTKELTEVEKYANEQREKGREDLADASLKYNKIITQADLDAAEESKKQKEKAFEAEKDRYEKLTDATKEYYEEVSKIEEEAVTKMQEIHDEEKKAIQEVNDEYNQALESRKEAIRGQFGLFDEFVKREEDSLSGKDLLNNLKSQLKGIEEWRENLDKLTERGIGEGLLDELRELGPKAAVEIEALTKLSDKKLTEYEETWKKLNEVVAEQANEELVDERAKADAEIEKIKEDTNAKIIVLQAEVQGKINEVGLKYMEGLSELGVQTAQVSKDVGVQIIKAIEIGVDETEESLLTKLNNLKDEVTEIVREIKRQVARAESAAASIDGSHKNGLDYVPHDGYIAQLHKGERVLTKSENERYNEGNVKTSGSQTLNVNFTGTMGQLIRVLNPQFTLEDDRGGVEY